MCEERQISARLFLWHWAQVSISIAVLRFAFRETLAITVWQLVQATSRVSCVLPFQCTWSPLSWQLMQIALLSAIEVLGSSLRYEIRPPTPRPPPSFTCRSSEERR